MYLKSKNCKAFIRQVGSVRNKLGRDLWGGGGIPPSPQLTHQWPYHCQTGFFFPKTFYTWISMTIPRFHKPGFLKPSLCDHGMVTDVQGQKKVKKIQSVRLWYGHWRTGSKTWLKKNDTVCQTVIWYWQVKKNVRTKGPIVTPESNHRALKPLWSLFILSVELS